MLVLSYNVRRSRPGLSGQSRAPRSRALEGMMRRRALWSGAGAGVDGGFGGGKRHLDRRSNGILQGATGVTVGGALYDVELLNGSCPALFSGCDAASDFQFQTSGAATLAAQALLDQVFLDGPQGMFDSLPLMNSGCAALTVESRSGLRNLYPFPASAFLPSLTLTLRGLASRLTVNRADYVSGRWPIHLS